MDAKMRAKMKKIGARVMTAKEFLGLSDAEAAIVEMRVDLALAVREQRKKAGMTQAELAKAVGSSQPRIAKIEAGDPQASLESMVRALTAAGAHVELRVA